MQLQLAFELRSPDCGAPHRELYAAMLDICAWADDVGFDVVNFGEHHGADSGYNPSPLIACAAVAGRTRRIRMRPNVLLAPLYDPVKLAEDCAVLALIAPERFSLAIGGGYRPSEFAMFGRRLDHLQGKEHQAVSHQDAAEVPGPEPGGEREREVAGENEERRGDARMDAGDRHQRGHQRRAQIGAEQGGKPGGGWNESRTRKPGEDQRRGRTALEQDSRP